MAAPSSTQPPSVATEDCKSCKCDDGWKCVITETEPDKAGKPFANCFGSSCSCITTDVSDPAKVQKLLESYSASKVYCKCDKGQSCVVSKTDGPEAGKIYFECGEGCICVIDQTNAVKVVCA